MLISSAIEVKVELFVAGIGLVTERREVNMTEGYCRPLTLHLTFWPLNRLSIRYGKK